MLEKFLSFIHEHKLFEREEKILLAVSGGADSIAMAHLFYEAKFNFAIAHCNFKLRGQESDEDEKFVKQLAEKWNVPFHNKTFSYTDWKEKTSIQLFARVQRYNWFNELLKEHNYNYIATAHHQNDVMETILLNLTRGTGIAGLHGIKNKRGNLIRPILFAKKEELIAYLKEKKISWREDSSNLSDYYKRNLIRNKIIPILKEMNPNLEKTMNEFAKKMDQVEKIFTNSIDEFEKKVKVQKGDSIYIHIDSLLEDRDYPIKLTHVINKYGFSYSQSESIIQSLQGQSGKVFYSDTQQLTKDREYLIISPIQSKLEKDEHRIEKNQKEFTNVHFTLEIVKKENKDIHFSDSSTIALLDYDQLEFPLTVRSWIFGDSFQPLGMNGKTKKISDLLIDKKIPLTEKMQTYVIVSGASVCWLIGHQIDDRYKITESTKWVLEVRWRRIIKE